MKRFSPLFLLLFLIGSPFLAEGATASSTPRIVSLMPSMTEMLYSLGFGSQIVGVSDYCNFPPAAASVPKVGGLELNLEKIVSLRPTVLIDLKGMHRRYEMFFHQVGLRYKDFQIDTIRDIPSAAVSLSELLQDPDKGKQFSDHWHNEMAKIPHAASATPLRVYVEIWDTPLQAAGPGSFIGEMVALLGGSIVTPQSPSHFPVVNPEEIIRADPEIILIAYPIRDSHSIGRRPGWSDNTAVRKGRIFKLNYDLFFRPGPRCLDALRELSTMFRRDGRK